MCGQFNVVLQQMRSSIRFIAGELELDDPGQIHTCREAGEGTGYPVYATEAYPLTIEAGDGGSAVLVFAWAADDPVFAAGQLIGKGRVAYLGAPVYSSFDLRRDVFANSHFTLALMV